MNNIYLYELEIEYLTELDISLLSMVSEERKNRILKYHFPIDQKLSLYAELITLLSVKEFKNIPLADIVIMHPNMKKPYLMDDSSIDFSYSHTKSCILYGITNEGRIGVDIERHENVNNVPYLIMPHVFHKEEMSYIEKTNSLHIKRSRFYEIWTKKEAYTKCFGTGLCTDITNINCLDTSLNSNFYSWENDNYTYSIYFENSQKICITYLTLNDIINFFIGKP